MRPLGTHLLLVLLNKPNLLRACIDHNWFTCCFSWVLERYDVIVTHYFMKVKCVSFYTLPKLASYSDSICCMLWFWSGGVKNYFHKKWRWRTRCTCYRVKFWWLKVRIGNAIHDSNKSRPLAGDLSTVNSDDVIRGWCWWQNRVSACCNFMLKWYIFTIFDLLVHI